MAINKKTRLLFSTYKQRLAEIGSDDILNIEMKESIFFQNVTFKHIYNLYKEGIITLKDLISSDDDYIFKALQESNLGVSFLNASLKKLCKSCTQESKAVLITNSKSLEILNAATEEQLDQPIDCDVDDVRLKNILEKEEIRTYRDLKETNIRQLKKTRGFGKKTFEKLVEIVENNILKDKKSESSKLGKDMRGQTELFKEKLLNCYLRSGSNYIQDECYSSIRKKLLNLILIFVGDNTTERRAKLYKMRYDIEKPATLQEVGDSIGVTRERIRQITAKVDSKILNHFLNDKESVLNPQIKEFYEVLIKFDDSKLISFVSFLNEQNDAISKILDYYLDLLKIDKRKLPYFITVEKEKVKKVPRKRRIYTPKPEKNPIDRAAILERSILSTILQSNNRFSVEEIIDFLKGRNTLFIRLNRYNEYKYYGCCKINYSDDAIKYAIYEFSDEELVKISQAKLSITNKGITYLKVLNKKMARQALD